jgi:hypothetical protein
LRQLISGGPSDSGCGFSVATNRVLKFIPQENAADSSQPTWGVSALVEEGLSHVVRAKS